MSGSILTLFGEEVVPEEQKPAAKTKGRKKSAKEEATEELTPAEPEATVEVVVAPPAPIITDLFGQPIVTAPVLAVTAPEPAPAAVPETAAAPAKRTRKKVSEEAIIDPTVFAEASLFDLFSGPQDLGKMAAEIQQHAAPAPMVSAPEIITVVPEPTQAGVIAETPALEVVPEAVREITIPEITAAIPEPTFVEERVEVPAMETVAEPEQEIVAPEIVTQFTEPAPVEIVAEIHAPEIVAEPEQEAFVPEIVAEFAETAPVEIVSEIHTPEIVAELEQEAFVPEIVAEFAETAPVEIVSEIHTPEIVAETVLIEPEVQITTEVIAGTTEEVIVAAEEPMMAEMPLVAETRDIEIPTEIQAIVAEDIQTETAAIPETAPTIEDVIDAPVEEVKMEIVAAEPEAVIAPIEPAVARMEVVPAELAMPEPVTEIVETTAPPAMEMVSPVTEVVVTKKKRTKKVVEAETESETAEPSASNNLPMDWQGHKTYYTIGEVAALFKVKTSNIRFWTNEFKLKVRTTRKGDRLYTPELVKEVRTIYHLVKERGFTLAGAKARLKTQNRKDVETVDLKQSLQQLRSQLVAIKNQLQ